MHPPAIEQSQIGSIGIEGKESVSFDFRVVRYTFERRMLAVSSSASPKSILQERNCYL